MSSTNIWGCTAICKALWEGCMCLDFRSSQFNMELRHEHQRQTSQIGNDEYHLCGGDNKNLRGRNNCSLIKSS